MEDIQSDPYEQQLLAVFESCDTDHKGSLTCSGLRQLCEKLELEEDGVKLINHLIEGKPIESRVTFHDFRDGLLALLGQGQGTEQTPSKEVLDKEEEATPKNITFGKKRYGRKSLPSNSSMTSTQILEVKEKEKVLEDVKIGDKSVVNVYPKRRKRGLSTEVPLTNNVDAKWERANEANESLKSSWVDTNVDGVDGLKVSRRSDSPSFYFQNAINLLPIHSSNINADLIVELWEASGIQKAASLLQDLGFNNTIVSIDELMQIMKEEIANLQNSNEGAWSMTETLLQALLTLFQEEYLNIKASIELIAGERDKLQLTVIEANERVSLLAQEVDENHARLEETARMQIKALEEKHTDDTKIIIEQRMEKDLLLSKNASLELKLKKLEELIAQKCAEIFSLKEEVCNVNSEKETALNNNCKIQAQFHLQRKELESLETVKQELEIMKLKYEVEQVFPLREKLSEVQAANIELTDKNDELSLKNEELSLKNEALVLELEKLREQFCKDVSICSKNLCDNECLKSHCYPTYSMEVPGAKPPSIENNLDPFVDSDKFRVMDQIGKLNEHISLLLVQNSKLNESKEALVEENAQLTARTNELTDQNSELCSSLEQMKEEYDKCEEYWSNKVEEERLLHDKEQQTLGNQYTELLSKIKEYEEDMEKASEDSDGRLSTIPERASYEMQVLALEEECRDLESKLQMTKKEQSAQIKKWKLCRTQLFKRIRHLKAHQKSRRKLSNSGDIIKCLKKHFTRLDVMEEKLKSTVDKANQERILCEKFQEAQEIREQEEIERAFKRQHEEMFAPQQQFKGLLLCNVESCNENKRAIFSKIQRQANYVLHLQKQIKRQKGEIIGMDLLIQRMKDQHRSEIEELEKLVNASETKLKSSVITQKKQVRHLIESDVILKDVYEENSRLLKNLRDLELRCRELVELSEKPGSVGKVC